MVAYERTIRFTTYATVIKKQLFGGSIAIFFVSLPNI